MKTVILNAAIGSWYPSGQQRLLQSLRDVGYAGEVLTWTNSLPPFSPSHQAIPYAFKCFAFQEARRRGYDLAFWLDSSMYAIASIDPILRHIEEHGAAVWRAGWTAAEWTHDRGLARLNLTRDEAAGTSLVCGGICGFDLRATKSIELLDAWLEYARDGESFPGPWKNQNGNCSADPRCLGHRHDMPSLSVLVQRHGLPIIDPPKWFAYFSDPPRPEALILARGM